MGTGSSHTNGSSGNAAGPDSAQRTRSLALRRMKAYAIDSSFATRFVPLSAESSPSDPLPGNAGVHDRSADLDRSLRQYVMEVSDRQVQVQEQLPDVTLVPGLVPEEAILSVIENAVVRRVVVRSAGDVGAIVFSALQNFDASRRALEEKLAKLSAAYRDAHAECDRLNEELALSWSSPVDGAARTGLAATLTWIACARHRLTRCLPVG